MNEKLLKKLIPLRDSTFYQEFGSVDIDNKTLGQIIEALQGQPDSKLVSISKKDSEIIGYFLTSGVAPPAHSKRLDELGEFLLKEALS